MNQQANTCRQGLPSAFTLIEMVVSLSVISIIFLAMGSVMVLASKALPSADTVSTRAFDATEITHRLTSELETAKTLTVSGLTAIEFTVADRDGDSNDEIIRYEWPGGAGQPLLRQYNRGNAVAVLPNAYEFALTYDTKNVAQADALTQSAEVLLSSQGQDASTKKYSVKKNDWIGQYFKPNALPAGAVTWSVTRALVMARNNGAANGQTLVQFRPPQPGSFLPTDTVLEQVTMYESDLTGSYAWYPFVFSNVRDLAPGDGLCLVLQWVVDNRAADILYNDNAPSGLLTTDDAGSSWNDESGKSMAYYVYGTYTTNTPQPPIVIVKSVTLTLNAGASPASRALTKVVTLNQLAMP